MRTLLDLGERQILQQIIPRFVAEAGNDCASIKLPIGELVATTDPVPPPAAASIGHDSDPFWMGWLLVTINASDLAAAGASPLAFLAAIECESNLAISAFERLLEGIKASCDDAGLSYVGGNIREARSLAAVGIGLGLCSPYKALGRAGARSGDVLLSVGQGGLFWRDAFRMLDGKGLVPKEESPLYRPRSQIKIMHQLAARGLVKAAMDNSDGLLPTLSELASKNGLGIEIDVDRLVVPGLTDEERDLQSRMWLGWGDWNVIVCLSPEHQHDAVKIVEESGGIAICIGWLSDRHSDVLLRRGDVVISAPRLESERFAQDSWMLKGVSEYVRILRSAPLP
jgi:thiamine-monophosphate kinase